MLILQLESSNFLTSGSTCLMSLSRAVKHGNKNEFTVHVTCFPREKGLKLALTFNSFPNFSQIRQKPINYVQLWGVYNLTHF